MSDLIKHGVHTRAGAQIVDIRACSRPTCAGVDVSVGEPLDVLVSCSVPEDSADPDFYGFGHGGFGERLGVGRDGGEISDRHGPKEDANLPMGPFSEGRTLPTLDSKTPTGIVARWCQCRWPVQQYQPHICGPSWIGSGISPTVVVKLVWPLTKLSASSNSETSTGLPGLSGLVGAAERACVRGSEDSCVWGEAEGPDPELKEAFIFDLVGVRRLKIWLLNK